MPSLRLLIRSQRAKSAPLINKTEGKIYFIWDSLTALKDRVLPDTQVGREIEYFCRFYKELAPKVVISYRRKAYCEGEFRLTLDRNILFRTEDLDLSLGIFGREVTDKVVMELKSERAIPFWLLELLNKHKVYKTPFSKYGTAYQIIKGEKTNG